MEYTDKYSYTRGQSINYSLTLHVVLLPGKYLIPRNIYETVRERLVNSPVQLNMPSIFFATVQSIKATSLASQCSQSRADFAIRDG